MSGSQYARLVPKLHRSRKLPKIDRPFRPRMVAWAGPSAFNTNRFYEMDKWYKARIDKPEIIPKLHIIDPANHNYSLTEFLEQEKGKVDAVNIGYKKPQIIDKKSSEANEDLERKSRKMELLIDVDILQSTGDLAIFKHFNIFDDLFGRGTFFENVQKCDIAFEDHAVFTGNVISPNDTLQRPQVSIAPVGKDGFNTLLMVNLDGNAFEQTSGEFIQWMVTNIPDGADITKGNEVVEYLQVLPFYGTGYHRVAFLLFRHEKTIDIPAFSNDILSRVHPIHKFYKKFEDQITPSAISFFQTSYDNSVKEKLHSLELKSPLYEYKYTEALKPEQKEYPLKAQPFDLYLDMYRDPKEVEREVLEERLKRAQLDDYQAPEILDINYVENKKTLPPWQHRRILAREGRYQGIYKNSL